MTLGLVAARALHFWSVAILLGGGGFLILLGADRIRSGVPVLRLAALVAAITGAAWFALTFANVTGGPANLLTSESWADFLASPFGPPWAVQLALGAVACGLCAQSRPVPFVLAGIALAIDQAWLGHAAIGTGALGPTMIASYIAHVIAGFAWVGALTMLCLAPRATGAMRDGLALFSTLGVIIVATIFASGCLNAAFHMNRISDLSTTAYGRILGLKIALFATMLLLAIFNRREKRYDRIGSRGLMVCVGLETFLGLLVLGAAAVLGITAPSS